MTGGKWAGLLNDVILTVCFARYGGAQRQLRNKSYAVPPHATKRQANILTLYKGGYSFSEQLVSLILEYIKGAIDCFEHKSSVLVQCLQ